MKNNIQNTDAAFDAIESIANKQLTLLTSNLAYLMAHSPFYKAKLHAYLTVINTFDTIEKIKELPFTTKEDIAQHNDDFLCVNSSEIIEYTSTSGTLGSPIYIAQNKNDIERLALNEELSLRSSTIQKDDVVQLLLTLDRQFMAGIAYYLGLKNIGAKIVRMGPAPIAAQIDSILKYKVTTLIAVPSFLLKLIEYCQEKNIPLNLLPVKKAICIGEPIREEFLQPNALAKKINAVWDIALYGTYASTEMQTAFAECEQQQGGHLHPELIFVEVLDDENRQVKNGEIGEVVITTLGVETMPLLRYRTGDLCKYYEEPCACGRNTIRLGPVLGRKNQLIKYKGTTLYPATLLNALHELDGVIDYFVEIIKDENEQDAILIFLHTKNTNLATENLLQAKLKVKPQLIFCDQKSIQQKRDVLNNRKVVKLVDLRT